MKIFISYSTRDGLIDATFLREVADSLPTSFCPFIDLLHNNSPDIQKRIEMEILNCELFVGLESPAFSKSPWVQFEMETAKRFQKRVIRFNVLKGAMPAGRSIYSCFERGNEAISA